MVPSCYVVLVLSLAGPTTRQHPVAPTEHRDAIRQHKAPQLGTGWDPGEEGIGMRRHRPRTPDTHPQMGAHGVHDEESCKRANVISLLFVVGTRPRGGTGPVCEHDIGQDGPQDLRVPDDARAPQLAPLFLGSGVPQHFLLRHLEFEVLGFQETRRDIVNHREKVA